MDKNILTIIRPNSSNVISSKFVFKKNTIFIEGDTTNSANKSSQFEVDYLLINKNQNDVFQIIRNNPIKSAIEGHNCAVFAYGQTGSGKTYTIQGNSSENGLIPRTIKYLHTQFKILELSYVEIYNENLIDLSINNQNNTQFSSALNKNIDCLPPNLIIREDTSTGEIFVDNLNIKKCFGETESLEFYYKGIKRRKTASTMHNNKSSRSHVIFTIYIENDKSHIKKRSKLSFIDLAGSENVKDYNNELIKINPSTKKIFKEACIINKSLVCLGKVVNELGRRRTGYIGYRDTKLTFLLKDCLGGGNSKLCMIGNINGNIINDSINTLKFIKRVQMLKCNPKINYSKDQSDPEVLREIIYKLEEKYKNLEEEHFNLKKSYSPDHLTIYNLKKVKKQVEEIKCNFEKYKVNNKIIFEIKFNEADKLRNINETMKELLSIYKDEINFEGIKSEKELKHNFF